MKDKIETLIFDVNETLLDLEPLKKSIDEALGNDHASQVWFAELLQYSLVESITDSYHDFSELASAIFKMNAKKYHKDFSDNEIKKILSPINELEPYPDVVPGLKQLKNSGFQLVAFSNGKPSVLKEQLDFARLSEYFDKILSVDSVKKYKPHSASYKYALKEANSNSENSMMVAAHGWDITGAMRAGLQTAFIQRPGKFVFPLSEKPTIETTTIQSLADILD